MTVNELMDALRDAERGNENVPDAYTMQELRLATGHSVDWLRIRIHEAVAAGTVEPIFVQRENLFGMTQRFPAYRFKRAA